MMLDATWYGYENSISGDVINSFPYRKKDESEHR